MEVEVVASQDSFEEAAGLDVSESEPAAAAAASENDEENINTNSIDMLQEHVYNNEDGSVDLAPELNVDENTILLPEAGENGLNADDPAIAFSASDFLQEEEEVTDPMDTNIPEEDEEPVTLTRSNRKTHDYKKTPSQVPKKRRDAVALKYELEDDVSSEKKRKRRGRKPGSKVINGQVFYPTDEQGITFSKNTPRGAAKSNSRSTPKPLREVDVTHVDESQCRVCMSAGDLISVFKKEHTKTYAEKLMAICPVVSIYRKDFLPQFICRICASSVNAAFALKTQCEQTDVELRDRLEKSIKKVRRPRSTSYVVPESEPEEFPEAPNDQEFKLSDATPPSAEDSDSDYGKPLSKRRTLRRTRKTPKAASASKAAVTERKYNSPSPRKRITKADIDMSTSKSSEQDAELVASDFSSGSEENYSPPKKRIPKKSRSIEGDLITCLICNETFLSKEELKEHKKTMHSQHECELCGRKFRVQSSLKAHMDKHTQSGELKCEQCEMHFRNKTERRKHMVDVHNEAPAQYVCEKCKRAFTTEVRLLKHNESRCPGFDMTQNKRRVDLESMSMGKDLFKCVAPLTTTYWSDSFSD